MDIIGKKNWYFLLSGIVIVPGIISLVLFGLNLGIDFTGGSKLELRLKQEDKQSLRPDGLKILRNEDIKSVFSEQNIEVGSIQKSGQETYIIKTKPISQEQNKKVQDALKAKFGEVQEVSFETVGATVSRETLINALKALILASVLIVLYIAFAFRNFRFGICAIIAVLHDVLVVVGIFSILGKTLNVEVDSLFVTALLTIIGFSVHDTIVVFDRIRENLKKMIGVNFAKIVNESIIQTMRRSINTSLTVILVLSVMLLFGGETIRWFVVALLVGIISGTYSSIFNASPLLVVWHEFSLRHSGKRSVS